MVSNSLSVKLIILFTLALPVMSMGQSVHVSASVSSDQIFLDETINLTIVFEGIQDFPSFKLPKLNDFSIISGPSQSSSYQVINGRVSTSKSFTWILAPLKEGKLTIPSFSVRIRGKAYTTEKITVRVFSRSKTSGKPQRPDNRTSEKMTEDYVFLKADLSTKEVYQGQEIIVDYILYAKKTPHNFSILSMPQAVGFWMEEYPTPKQPRLETEIRNGVRYQKANIQKLALFPTKTGELTVDPLQIVTQIELPVQKRRSSWFDDFFSDPFFDSPFNSRLVNKNLSSEPVIVRVLPLPEQGKPEDFTGAVGRYSFSVSLDTNRVIQGDAFSLRVNVKGYGNPKIFNLPEIHLPEEFEIFSPQSSQDLSWSNGHVLGEKTAEYVIIPRKAGSFTLPALYFSYFDPIRKKYIRLRGATLKIDVKPSEEKSFTSGVGFSRKEIALLNQDIRFIKTTSEDWVEVNSLKTSVFFRLSLILAVLLVTLSVGYNRWRETVRNDIGFVRRRNAWKNAAKELEQANIAFRAEELKECLHGCLRMIITYIADRKNLPLSGMSAGEYAKLIRKLLTDKTFEELYSYLTSIEEKYYSPQKITKPEASEILEKGKRILTEIRKFV